MATRTQTYGYGVTAPKAPKPVSTGPLGMYGGTPYQSAGAQARAGIGTGGALNTVAPVKALGTPGVNATQVAAAPAPTDPNVYDITTDPALQAIQALTGKSSADAQAAALKQEQGQLLGYGDPTLAQSVLNDPTIAQAAGANPTSTLAQLGQSRTRNLGTLTEDLNKNNLFYGGYRVTQEQQAAQDYQNALAKAAGDVNTNLDTIQGNLAQALAANQAQDIAAMQAAYAANPAGTAATQSSASPTGSYGQPLIDYTGSGAGLSPSVLNGNVPTNPGPTGNTAFDVANQQASDAARIAYNNAVAGTSGGTSSTPTVDPNVRRLALALAPQYQQAGTASRAV